MNTISRRRFLETTMFAGATSLVASRLALANAPLKGAGYFKVPRIIERQ